MKWLIYGGNGWIGTYIIKVLNNLGYNDVIIGQSRLDNIIDLENEIKNILPDRVISSIGRTSGPGYNNIDYLEQKGKLVDNIRDNLYSNFNLAFITNKYNIHLAYFGTGCIFTGYNNDNGFSEEDKPNFFGSSYSIVKGFTDQIMICFNNVLNVRIRMPIMDDCNSKNFIIKLLSYKKICSIPNSMSILPELIPILIDMCVNKHVGTINLVNPGLISHNEILEIIKQYKIPNLQWENFTLEEQKQVLLADRSNNLLNTSKLEKMYKVSNIKDGLVNLIKNLDLNIP